MIFQFIFSYFGPIFHFRFKARYLPHDLLFPICYISLNIGHINVIWLCYLLYAFPLELFTYHLDMFLRTIHSKFVVQLFWPCVPLLLTTENICTLCLQVRWDTLSSNSVVVSSINAAVEHSNKHPVVRQCLNNVEAPKLGGGKLSNTYICHLAQVITLTSRVASFPKKVLINRLD